MPDTGQALELDTTYYPTSASSDPHDLNRIGVQRGTVAVGVGTPLWTQFLGGSITDLRPGGISRVAVGLAIDEEVIIPGYVIAESEVLVAAAQWSLKNQMEQQIYPGIQTAIELDGKYGCETAKYMSVFAQYIRLPEAASMLFPKGGANLDAVPAGGFVMGAYEAQLLWAFHPGLQSYVLNAFLQGRPLPMSGEETPPAMFFPTDPFYATPFVNCPGFAASELWTSYFGKPVPYTGVPPTVFAGITPGQTPGVEPGGFQKTGTVVGKKKMSGLAVAGVGAGVAAAAVLGYKYLIK